MNKYFQAAIKRQHQTQVPIWMMRQAGRYHSHYQNLKKTHTFSQLCLSPKLAAQVAMGPIEDFDFDVAILFSDILFPLMAIGVDLIFEEFGGPKLQTPMHADVLKKAPDTQKSLQYMLFQKEAMQETRKLLSSDKSLIGFVGGPWTLFTFATQGTHKNGIREAKRLAPELWTGFSEIMLPLLKENIALQLSGGAELVMLFDTAAGELAFEELEEKVIRPLQFLSQAYPGQLGYYAKGISSEALHLIQKRVPQLLGQGIDHRLMLTEHVKVAPGFIQGNFDPELLLLPSKNFQVCMRQWWNSLQWKSHKDLTGWVCGLGHGILPGTPESNVRDFVRQIRQWCQEI